MTGLWRPDIDPGHEPHKVLLIRDKILDTSRNRVIPIKVYYPAEPSLGNLPVVMWSHGLGGSVDGAGFLSRYIASHGYVIVHVQHPGSDSGLWEGKPGHPWDIIRATKIPRGATLERFKDVPFLLDQLPAWMAAHPEAGALADLLNIGMSGHSFGAMTTQVMAGQLMPDENKVLTSYRDPRFKAGILYSPVPVRHITEEPDENVYGPISLPLFHITGTDDSSPIEGFDYRLRQIVYQNTQHPEKYMLIINEGDHMVFNGSRGKLGQNPNRDKHESMIKIAALAYWDMKLKNDPVAQEWVTGGGLEAWLKDEGTFDFTA